MRSSAAIAERSLVHRSRLDIQQLKVNVLVEQYRSGHLLIPEFQREYVWKPNRAPLLIDSLYRGYPISALLVWVSASECRVRRSDPRPVFGRTVSWLIDGQQRVITLARILEGDSGVDVAFNPDEDRFRLTNAATRRSRSWFRVSELLNDRTYWELRREFSDDPRGRMWESKFERLRSILDYEIPAVLMIDHSFDEAVEAFTRINTLGMKLKRADLASAQVAGKHAGFVADEVAPFLSKVQTHGFSRLNAMHLFRVCGYVAAADRTYTPLHELSLTDVRQAWNKTKNATEEAVAILRDQFGLSDMSILSSGALLAPVIALCAYAPQSARDHQAMAGWLAAAALAHRYQKGLDSLDQDLRACWSEDPIGRLLANVRKDGRGLLATPSDFVGRVYDRGAVFAAYAACHHMGLVDIFTGAPIPLSGTIERHHLLPRSQFSLKRRLGADALANIAFSNADTSRLGGSRSPEGYMARLGKLSAQALASQCIPAEKDLWRVERAEEFWQKRRVLLTEGFNGFLRTKLRGRKIE